MPCKVWISALCSILLSLGLLHSTRAFQPRESNPWLALYAPYQHLSLADGQAPEPDTLGFDDTYEEILADPYLPWDDGDASMDTELRGKQKALTSAAKRHKRVFLSRGWAAGGYKAPSPSPNRFVRRPPGIVETPVQYTKPIPVSNPGEAHYAALVSDEPQQSPSYRRFHSIFTSGMWTPMGKRSRVGGRLSPVEAQEMN